VIERELSIPSFSLVKSLEHSAVDRYLQFARHCASTVVGTFIALSCCHPTIQSFRDQQLKNVAEGRRIVLSVQKIRSPGLDKFLACASFCAEEEFYLIVLPFLYWNVEWALGHHMLFVTCVGLFLGNFLKDVFQLPRPQGVWRSSDAAATDSTSCQDFGFPSTHTMNSISNAGFMLLYVHDPLNQFGVKERAVWPLCISAVLAVMWIVTISGGRLYLGVHSPPDLKGGTVLGLLMASWYFLMPVATEWLTTTPYLGLKLWCLSWALLMLCPQVRPATPSFLQNAVCLGLVMGNAYGASFHQQHLSVAHVPLHGYLCDLGVGPVPWLARYLLGMVLVVVLRAVVKIVTGGLISLFGARVRPQPGKTVLSLRGTDLGALAFQKISVYFTVSFTVSFGCPLLFHMVGLYSA